MNKSNALFRCISPTVVKAALTIGFLLPAVSQASLYLGTFNTLGQVAIRTSVIDFQGPYTLFNGTGQFSTLNATGGTVTDITSPPYTTPGSTFFSTPNFMTFTGAPNISFTLQVLDAGSQGVGGCTAAPPAGGQNCTPPNSPYNLTNLSSTLSVASFSVRGIEVDSTTGQTANFVGVFSATFPTPFQTVLGRVNSGGTQPATFSGSFTVTPEPSIFLPLGAGMIALFGARAFRKRSKTTV